MATACGSSTTTDTTLADTGAASGDSVADTNGVVDTGTTTAETGGPCTAATCTGAGMTCDPEDMKCKPDGTGSKVGATCPKTGPNPACGTAARSTCNDNVSDGFPGGYCSYEPCTEKELCPVGSSCAAIGGETPACWKNCKTNSDCRAPDYECLDVGMTLYVSGASHKVCFLVKYPCAVDGDCPPSKPKCDMTTKLCK